MEEFIFLQCYRPITLLKLNFLTSIFKRFFNRFFKKEIKEPKVNNGVDNNVATMPFQNYLIHNLFNCIYLILDFRSTEIRKVPFRKENQNSFIPNK